MILALDLGTRTGFALEGKPGEEPSVGTWVLASDKELRESRKLRMDRRCDLRVSRLYKHLRELHTVFPLEWIVFEDVQFASSTLQVQLWSSLRAAVWLMADLGVQIECCAVGTLKKFATGSGTADKDRMMRSLAAKNPRFVLNSGSLFDTVRDTRIDDNAVDALHLLYWAQRLLRFEQPKKQ